MPSRSEGTLPAMSSSGTSVASSVTGAKAGRDAKRSRNENKKWPRRESLTSREEPHSWMLAAPSPNARSGWGSGTPRTTRRSQGLWQQGAASWRRKTGTPHAKFRLCDYCGDNGGVDPACTLAADDFEVALLAPVGSPAVLDEPIGL